MTKGMYHFIRESWKSPDQKVLRERMTKWRSEGAIVQVEKPLRLDKARALGYKAKNGFMVVRVKILRGGRARPRPRKARKKGRTLSVKKILAISYQGVAEQRAGRKYQNLEVLNSYEVGKDGMNYFYEVILVDPSVPEIKSDPTINWICKKDNRKRAFRGLTSAGTKSRALR
jgi:large subunit ribosomal protein L15e